MAFESQLFYISIGHRAFIFALLFYAVWFHILKAPTKQEFSAQLKGGAKACFIGAAIFGLLGAGLILYGSINMNLALDVWIISAICAASFAIASFIVIKVAHVQYSNLLLLFFVWLCAELMVINSLAGSKIFGFASLAVSTIALCLIVIIACVSYVLYHKFENKHHNLLVLVVSYVPIVMAILYCLILATTAAA